MRTRSSSSVSAMKKEEDFIGMSGRFLAIALFLGSTGCTIKATLNQTTDTTSNITGTTSGAAWWSEDGQIKPDFKATAFVSI